MSSSASPDRGPNTAAAASTLQEAKLQHSRLLRQSVVQAAASLLTEHGPEAVTVRRVADKMECSTKIIYNLFTNKEGLAKELYLEGCRLLAQEFESVLLTGNPAADLRLLAEAYWRFGEEHTSYYQVMFGGSFAEFKPDEDSMQGMTTALSQVSSLVASAGNSSSIESTLAVRLVWAPLHGVIHLYLSGQLGDKKEVMKLYDHTVDMIVRTLFPE